MPPHETGRLDSLQHLTFLSHSASLGQVDNHAGHAWVEAWVENRCGRWVHIDPCEAAVDDARSKHMDDAWSGNQMEVLVDSLAGNVDLQGT